MQRRLYLTKLREFDVIYIKVGSDWVKFIERIKTIYENAGESEQAIWDLLHNEASAFS